MATRQRTTTSPANRAYSDVVQRIISGKILPGGLKNTPNRSTIPGGALGMTDAQMKNFNIAQKRTKGFLFAAGVGVTTPQGIQLTGTAKFLLGINVLDDSGDITNQLSLSINNDTIIEATSWVQLSNLTNGVGFGSSFDKEFVEYPRPLQGNDSINIAYQATTAGNVIITFYFI